MTVLNLCGKVTVVITSFPFLAQNRYKLVYPTVGKSTEWIVIQLATYTRQRHSILDLQNTVVLLHVSYPFPPQLHLQPVVPVDIDLHIKGKIGTDLNVIAPSCLLIADVKVIVVNLPQRPADPPVILILYLLWLVA